MPKFAPKSKIKITMSRKAVNIIQWSMTALLVAVLTFSSAIKITQQESAVAQAASFGIDAQTYLLIGVVEIISVILFIIPRTGLLGTLLLAAYLGGAMVTHLLHQESILQPAVLQTLLWVTAAVRFPELRQRLFAPKKTQIS